MNLWTEFCKRAEKGPNEEALVVYKRKDRRSITYSELKAAAAKISNTLMEMGLKKGEICLLLAPTNILWAKLALAIARTGALLVPVDPTLSKEEAEDILRQVQPKIALVESEFENKIDEDLVGRIITLGGSKKHSTINQLLFQATREVIPPKIKEQDPLVVPYTSGTTGEAKGAVLTHQGFLEVTYPAAIERLNLTPEEVIVTIGPWHHVMGYFALVTSLLLGAKLVYTNDFRRVLAILAEEKGTILLAPPKLFNVMLERIKQGVQDKGSLARLLWRIWPKKVGQRLRRQYGLENLKFFVAGSAKSDPQVVEGFRRLGIGYVEGYGMSENCSLSHISSPFNQKAGSVGPLIPGMAQMIVRVKQQGDKWVPILDKQGKPLQAGIGEYGELWLQGPNIMQGYLEKPELTAEVLDKDGWFRTGDSGMLDQEGWLWLRGRIDEVMVTGGGKNVSKIEVEQTLLRSPLVEEVVVDYVGGRIRAKIYPDFEKLCARALTPTEAGKYIQENKPKIIETLWQDLEKRQQELAPFKRVSRAGIEIVPKPFEKTSTQKIKRHKVE